MIDLCFKTLLKRENTIRKYYEVRKRVRNIKKTKDKIPPYLRDNNFEIELNFKLWVTKGARFKASERCEILDRRSAKIVGWLSAYLIIFSVLSICNIEALILKQNIANFVTISISIMILVFSQFEYAMNYSTKAKAYHDCALQISGLYDQLRILKSHEIDTKNRLEKVQEITQKYQSILERNINHLPIDYKIFSIDKPAYFNLSNRQKYGIKFTHYLKTKFALHFLVYGLPVVYIAFIILRQE